MNIHAMKYGTQPFQTTVSVCEEHKTELEELKYDFFSKLRYTIKIGILLGNFTDEMVKKSTFGNYSTAFRSLWGVRESSDIVSYEFIDLKELSTKEKRIRDELKERFIVSMECKKNGFLTDDDYREILEEAINVSSVRKVMNS